MNDSSWHSAAKLIPPFFGISPNVSDSDDDDATRFWNVKQGEFATPDQETSNWKPPTRSHARELSQQCRGCFDLSQQFNTPTFLQVFCLNKETLQVSLSGPRPDDFPFHAREARIRALTSLQGDTRSGCCWYSCQRCSTNSANAGLSSEVSSMTSFQSSAIRVILSSSGNCARPGKRSAIMAKDYDIKAVESMLDGPPLPFWYSIHSSMA